MHAGGTCHAVALGAGPSPSWHAKLQELPLTSETTELRLRAANGCLMDVRLRAASEACSWPTFSTSDCKGLDQAPAIPRIKKASEELSYTAPLQTALQTQTVCSIGCGGGEGVSGLLFLARGV
eukprot:1161136-Pelagomonas_calceolata.AAC.6